MIGFFDSLVYLILRDGPYGQMGLECERGLDQLCPHWNNYFIEAEVEGIPRGKCSGPIFLPLYPVI